MPTYTTGVQTDLYTMSAQQLGDPLAWWQIAQLNGLRDTEVPANVTLQMPTAGQPDNDGLPSQ